MQLKSALAFLLAAVTGSSVARELADPPRDQGRSGHPHLLMQGLEPIRLPPVSTPALAAGALAIGALAVGALAIGALAIGRLEIRQARLRKLEIDDLTVHRLHIVEGQPKGSTE